MNFFKNTKFGFWLYNFIFFYVGWGVLMYFIEDVDVLAMWFFRDTSIMAAIVACISTWRKFRRKAVTKNGLKKKDAESKPQLRT